MQPYSLFSLGRFLLVSMQEEIGDIQIEEMFEDLTELVQRKGIRGVIVDLKDAEVLDTYFARHLETLSATLHLLNARVVVVGLSVPVVLTLTDFGIELTGLDFALDVEKAVVKLEEFSMAAEAEDDESPLLL